MGAFVERMEMRAALGALKVACAPLDPDALSVPERALVGEWIADVWRRRKEAQEKAAAEAKSKSKTARGR